MKLPRNLNASSLKKALKKLGYLSTRQTGSHIRFTTQEMGEHHITIPNHNPLKVGTLSAIFSDIAEHFETSKEEVLKKLF